SPLGVAGASGGWATAGVRAERTAGRAIADAEGQAEEPGPSRSAAARADEAFLLTYLLRGVVDRGTGAAARGLGVDGVVAGKTGTTNDGRDAWFVGYTP